MGPSDKLRISYDGNRLNTTLCGLNDVLYISQESYSTIQAYIDAGTFPNIVDGKVTLHQAVTWTEQLRFERADSNSPYYRFYDNGHGKIGEIDFSTLSALRDRAANLIDNRHDALIQKCSFHLLAYNGEYLLTTINPLWGLDKELSDAILLNPAVGAFLDYIYQGEKWLPITTRILTNVTNGTFAGPHKDQSFFATKYRKTPNVTVQFELEDPALTNGGLRFLSKSQRLLIDGVEPKSLPLEEFECPIKYGDIYVFNTGVFHGSFPNFQEKTRYVLYMSVLSLEEALQTYRPSTWVDTRCSIMKDAGIW